LSQNTRKLRVLLISHTCQSRTEGQPKAHYLGATPDIELCVLVPDRWKRYGAWRAAQPPESPNFDFRIGRIACPWSGPGQTYLHHYPALPKLLREFKPDVIDLWEEPWSLVSAHTCYWRDRICPGAKIISETEQNIDKKLPFPFEPFRAHVLKKADFVVGRNTEAIEIVRRKGYTGRHQVVPNAVDTTLFGPQDRKACRLKMGVEGFVVGYVGRLVEQKGTGDLVAALLHCPQEVSLIFVGAGPFESELKARVAAVGLDSRVKFLGARPLEELPTLFGAFDTMVLPSRTTATWKEQFGRVLIEAGACEIPVIGSDSGAIPEVIGLGEEAMGLVFPEGNASALADAILAIKKDTLLAKKFGSNGARRAREEFSWSQVAARMADIYREVSR
jgi:glycosyltransferase involved in cell wall biosynthesis